ncbi:MAG: serine--tRNA ligase [Patescibacteria group bacterium]
MLDIKKLKEDEAAAIHSLEARGLKDAKKLIQTAIDEHEAYVHKLQKAEVLKSKLNSLSKKISTLQGDEKKAALAEAKKFSAATVNTNVVSGMALSRLPNIPLADVPIGLNATGNITIREHGKHVKLQEPQDYLSLAEILGIIDMPRGAKVSGSRFGYLKGAGALLEFALIQYAMQELTKAGFTAVVPPVIVNEPYMEAMGYLAQGGADEVYHLEKDKQYLVGTSEQSVGPYHANELIPEKELPKKYAAFSTCFRREAGSYGKDTKGILRVHQFDKVEMFVVCAPSDSEKLHHELLAMQEKLVQGLGIPYRVVQLCTGDLGFPSAKTYDIECWLPGQNSGKGEYRETHSTSNTTDYQARALNIRMKGQDGKNVIAHLLNGTAFAIGRTIIAILENYQQSDGSVKIPEVLAPYMHGINVITKT